MDLSFFHPLVASRQAGNVEFHEPVNEATQWATRRALTLGRRTDPAATRDARSGRETLPRR